MVFLVPLYRRIKHQRISEQRAFLGGQRRVGHKDSVGCVRSRRVLPDSGAGRECERTGRQQRAEYVRLHSWKLHRGYLLCGDAGRRPVKHWLRLPWNFGQPVDPTFGIFASKTAGSDCPINVLYVGVHAAQLALAFGTTLAERGHGSRLYDFKKIKLSDGAGL